LSYSIQKREQGIKSAEVFYFLYGGLGNSILAYPAIKVLSENFKTKIFLFNSLQKEFLEISGINAEVEFSENFLKALRKLKNEKIYASTHNLYAPYKKHPFIYFFLKSEIRIGLKNKNYLGFYNRVVPFIKKEKEGNLKLIEPLSIENQKWTPSEIKNEKGYVLLFPGSSKKFKNFKRWKYFVEFGKKIKKDFNVLCVLGPEEIDLKEVFEDNKIEVYVSKNLKNLLSLFEKSIFYIGNDTAITHLASWFGLKGIVIYTSTDPEKNETLYKSIKITPDLSCFPCYKFFKTKCINKEKFKCTYLVKPEEIEKIFYKISG